MKTPKLDVKLCERNNIWRADIFLDNKWHITTIIDDNKNNFNRRVRAALRPFPNAEVKMYFEMLNK